MPEARGGWRLSAWCVVAAFGAYFCTYAFRKPFTGGEFKASIGGFQEMTLLVIAQGLGYTVSKFIGIKVIAEMTPGRRVTTLLALIGFAQVALFFFALTPAPFNCLFLFLNGLPLGIVFGLILGFLEGRRHTEALTAGLCASFIIADGATKSVGMGLLRIRRAGSMDAVRRRVAVRAAALAVCVDAVAHSGAVPGRRGRPLGAPADEPERSAGNSSPATPPGFRRWWRSIFC